MLPQNSRLNKLIIVEGMTGLGKSTLAHFIARQLHYHDIEAAWIHEGELQHPLSLELDSGDIDRFMQTARTKWLRFVSRIARSKETIVLEAGFFNNLLETLFLQNVPSPKIYHYSDVLQDIIQPIQPALVYLTHSDIRKALAESFTRRGAGFKDFVIKFATTTPYAQHRSLAGYDGMIDFWVDFVTLTDQLYDRFRFKKIALHKSSGNRETLNQQVLDFLAIPFVIEKQVTEAVVKEYVGTYKDQTNERRFDVRYRNHKLIANLFLDDWTCLIPKTEDKFIAEGWHFVVHFDKDSSGEIASIRIEGEDVDYLSLVGTVAKKVIS